LPVLPKAWRYKFVADFATMIGIDNLSFKRGQIINRDGIDPRLIEQLYARGAMLEAVD
jgi:hypothetical protein